MKGTLRKCACQVPLDIERPLITLGTYSALPSPAVSCCCYCYERKYPCRSTSCSVDDVFSRCGTIVSTLLGRSWRISYPHHLTSMALAWHVPFVSATLYFAVSAQPQLYFPIWLGLIDMIPRPSHAATKPNLVCPRYLVAIYDPTRRLVVRLTERCHS